MQVRCGCWVCGFARRGRTREEPELWRFGHGGKRRRSRTGSMIRRRNKPGERGNGTRSSQWVSSEELIVPGKSWWPKSWWWSFAGRGGDEDEADAYRSSRPNSLCVGDVGGEAVLRSSFASLRWHPSSGAMVRWRSVVLMVLEPRRKKEGSGWRRL